MRLPSRVKAFVIAAAAIVLLTAAYAAPLISNLGGGQTPLPREEACTWPHVGESVAGVPGIPGIDVYATVSPGTNDSITVVVNIVNRRSEAVTLTFAHQPELSITAISSTGSSAAVLTTVKRGPTVRTLGPEQSLQLSVPVASDPRVVALLVELPDLGVNTLLWVRDPRDDVVACGLERIGFDGGVLLLRWLALKQGLFVFDPLIIVQVPVFEALVPANTTVYELRVYDTEGRTVVEAAYTTTSELVLRAYAGAGVSGVIALKPVATTLLGEPKVVDVRLGIQLRGLERSSYLATIDKWTSEWPGRWLRVSDSWYVDDGLRLTAVVAYNGYYAVLNLTLVNEVQEMKNITGRLSFTLRGLRISWYNATVYGPNGTIVDRYPGTEGRGFPLTIGVKPGESVTTTVVLLAPHDRAERIEIVFMGEKRVIALPRPS